MLARFSPFFALLLSSWTLLSSYYLNFCTSCSSRMQFSRYPEKETVIHFFNYNYYTVLTTKNSYCTHSGEEVSHCSTLTIDDRTTNNFLAVLEQYHGGQLFTSRRVRNTVFFGSIWISSYVYLTEFEVIQTIPTYDELYQVTI